MFVVTLFLFLGVSLIAPRAYAQDGSLRLSYERTLDLARQRSPDVVISKRRAGETRGALTGARVLVQQNPIIEGRVGPRTRGRQVVDHDVEIALDFPLEIYGQRGLRIDAAELAVGRAEILVEESSRRALVEALSAYYRALRAEAQVTWSNQQASLAEELLRITERRAAAGDVGDLDVRVTRVELARARRNARTASAERESALAALRIGLGLPAEQEVIIAGGLADARDRYGDAQARRATEARPDVRAAEADVLTARAELDLEERLAWPNPALRLSYGREEGANVFLAGMAIPLSIFERNQGRIAQAEARVARSATERDFTQLRARTEAEAARRRYALALESLDGFEADAIPLLDENLRLAQRSYETGQTRLTELLTVRREALETRREYFDAQLEFATAGVELQAALGALR